MEIDPKGEDTHLRDGRRHCLEKRIAYRTKAPSVARFSRIASRPTAPLARIRYWQTQVAAHHHGASSGRRRSGKVITDRAARSALEIPAACRFDRYRTSLSFRVI